MYILAEKFFTEKPPRGDHGRNVEKIAEGDHSAFFRRKFFP
jgi:hypothetical protein